ncbi:MAG: helix-turn-helix transcriptional regulator [Candidatus Magasanikbacteria bacterium]
MSNVLQTNATIIPQGPNYIPYWRKQTWGRPGTGMSQRDLAALIGLNSQSIGRIEKGTRMPSIEVLFSIAAALEIPPHILYPELWQKKIQELKDKKLSLWGHNEVGRDHSSFNN